MSQTPPDTSKPRPGSLFPESIPPTSIMRRKPLHLLQAEASGEAGMRRTLGALDLAMIGIGGIIGAGIFVLTGNAAAHYAGPGITLSFVFAAVACGLAGLCYSEFASLIPIAGSAYTYAYATLGEFLAWIIGWDLVLEYAMGAATVAVGWSGYVVSLLRGFGIHIPPQIVASPGTELVRVPADLVSSAHMHVAPGWHTLASVQGDLVRAGTSLAGLEHATAIVNLPAVVVVLGVTALLVVGIRESASVNAVIVMIKLAIIVTVIGVGAHYVNPANWHPFVPPNAGEFGHFGWSGVARGAGVIFFAYIGFDAVSTAAQEAKNPQRDMPIGILGSLVVCTILYILVALVLTGVVHFSMLGVPDPIAVAVDAMGLRWLAVLVKVGAVLGLTSVVLVLLMGQPRIFFSMSRDGLLPPVFSRTHPRFRTPYITTIVTGAVVAVVAALAPISILGELVSIGTLSAFIIVCLGVWMLRRAHPEIDRPFRTPLVPLVPILGALACLYLMIGLPLDTWIRLVVWMAIGLVIYFGYGRRHSHIAAMALERVGERATGGSGKTPAGE
jgi:APA family basic amino acid/polyamine antiporter